MTDLVREKADCLLIGVTGGIASGKSTVSDMLESMGAKTIDFDLLARKIVQPGMPALMDIEKYFGSKILFPDKTLDRKKLSKIVFNDRAKLKKLEEFTHPRIYQLFLKQVAEIAEKGPGSVIQAVIPLLIEQNRQHLFDKIVVVYIPAREQIRRLAARDGISREDAVQILKSQAPIDDKLKHADFIVRNEGDLEKTRDQARALWKVLQIGQNFY